MRKRFEQFDGLRMYAILLIIASHAKAWNLNVGSAMVALFFTLGGFFTARPFASDHKELSSLTRPVNWLVYYIHRAARLIPAYYLVLAVTWYLRLFKGKQQGFPVLLDNLLFRNVNGHFWYVQNLALITLFVPLLLLLGYFIKKLLGSKSWINLLLGCFYILLGLGLHYYFRYVSKFYLLGNTVHQYLRIGLFCIGIGFGYLVKHLNGFTLNKWWQRETVDIIILALLVAAAASTSNHLIALGIISKPLNIGAKYPAVCALVFGMLFLLLSINGDSLLSRLMGSRIPQAVGEASYTIYLVQSIILRCIKVSGGPGKKWLLASIISICIGYACYHLFEKPINAFIKSRIRIKDK